MVIRCAKYRESRPSVGISFEDASLTVQAPKEECDINNIISRYLRTGEPPEVRKGAYMDLSELPDFQTALEIVRVGEDAFLSLPADVRKYFDNDPSKLIAFSMDPANNAKAVELGLADKKAQSITPPSQPIPPSGESNAKS